MATAYAQLATAPQHPAASRWDCETAASGSLLSETLFEAGYFENGLAEGNHSTEALQKTADACCARGHPALAQELASTAFIGADQRDQSAIEQLGKPDILEMIRQQMDVEADVRPPLGFLSPQQQQDVAAVPFEALTPAMRMIIVSWMVEVAEEFRLQQETLHLAVGLLDRFLCSTQDVPCCVLQLLAVACILLAAKGLEVVQPTVEQLCAVTANHFKPHDLLRMERILLDVLGFWLTSPSSYTFLHLLAQACNNSVTPVVLSLAMYLCELAVLDYNMHIYTHSCRAAAALLLSQVAVGADQHLLVVTCTVNRLGLPAEQLYCCMTALLRLQRTAYMHTMAAAVRASVVPMSFGEKSADLLAPLRAKFGAGCWCEVTYLAPLLGAPVLAAWAGLQQ